MCDALGRPYEDLILADANQEHGIVALRPGARAALPELALGAQLRILPNHACATGAQHQAYQLVRGDADAISATWPRIGGW